MAFRSLFPALQVLKFAVSGNQSFGVGSQLLEMPVNGVIRLVGNRGGRFGHGGVQVHQRGGDGLLHLIQFVLQVADALVPAPEGSDKRGVRSGWVRPVSKRLFQLVTDSVRVELDNQRPKTFAIPQRIGYRYTKIAQQRIGGGWSESVQTASSGINPQQLRRLRRRRLRG